MKFRNLILAGMAAMTLFAACQGTEQPKPAAISVDKESIEFSETASTESLTLEATRDWTSTVTYDSDGEKWLSISPASGLASSQKQAIKVSALPNSGYDRAATVKFTIGLGDALVTISQKGAKGQKREGSGTLEDPFTVSGILKHVSEMDSDVESDNNVYIKGKIKEIVEPFSSFGNSTFDIVDDDDATTVFKVYRALGLGNKKCTNPDAIKVGDEVIVCGKVVNYKGNTPETVQNKAFLYSINGVSEGGDSDVPADPKGDGTLENPYNADGANAYIATLGADEESPKDIYIKGKVKEIADPFGSYGNVTFYLSDNGTDGNTFYVFRALGLGNKACTDPEALKVGDEVIVCGKVVNYKGDTPETVQKKAYLYSVNGNTDDGTPVEKYSGEGLVVAVSARAFLIKTSDSYAYAYDSEKTPEVKVGDKVKLNGEIQKYNDLDEVVNYTAEIISSGNEVSHPEAASVAGSAMDSYNTMFGYVSFSGKLSINADKGYYNVAIAGSTKTASLANAAASLVPASLDGKVVDAEGYFIGLTGSGTYFNIICVSIKESDDQTWEGGEDTPPASVSLEPGENEVLHLLSNAEICAVMTASNSTYITGTIASEGGDWTANYSPNKTNTYLQFRNNNASYLTSPEYSTKVTRIVMLTAGSKFQQSSAGKMNVYAVPVVDPAKLPTGKDADGKTINYTSEVWAVNYGYCTFVKNEGAQTGEISVSEDIKQFSIISADGAMYLDAIYVFCEK